MTIKKTFLITLLIIFLMIIGLSFGVYWQFKGFQESLSEANVPEFKMPEIDSNFLFGGQNGLKEFTIPDQKLKIKYPGYWMEMEEKSLKSYFSETAETEKAKTLFFAMRFNLKSPVLAFLVVQELNLEKDLEKAIQGIKQDVEDRGGKMEISNLTLEENWAEFEAEYQSQAGNIFYSKQKLILGSEKLYLTAIFSLEKDWYQIENEANGILDSVILIPEVLE